jgi:hypothetical protein
MLILDVGSEVLTSANALSHTSNLEDQGSAICLPAVLVALFVSDYLFLLRNFWPYIMIFMNMSLTAIAMVWWPFVAQEFWAL